MLKLHLGYVIKTVVVTILLLNGLVPGQRNGVLEFVPKLFEPSAICIISNFWCLLLWTKRPMK